MEKARMKVIRFSSQDVIATSGLYGPDTGKLLIEGIGGMDSIIEVNKNPYTLLMDGSGYFFDNNQGLLNLLGGYMTKKQETPYDSPYAYRLLKSTEEIPTGEGTLNRPMDFVTLAANDYDSLETYNGLYEYLRDGYFRRSD